jgi:hypothetical protein
MLYKINEIRRDVLLDVHELLSRTSPKENTFHDTYSYALSKLLGVAETLDADIKKRESESNKQPLEAKEV